MRLSEYLIGELDLAANRITGTDILLLRSALADRESHVMNALAHPTDEVRQAAITFLKDDRLLDNVTAQLLAYNGFDPVIIAAIVRQIGEFSIYVGDDENDPMGFEPYIDIVISGNTRYSIVQIAPDVTWNEDGRITLNIPETVRNQVAGRKLNEIISHPLLDSLDVSIENISTDTKGKTCLNFNRSLQLLRPEDLFTIYPRRINS